MLRVSALALVTSCAAERLSVPLGVERIGRANPGPIATHVCIDQCGQPPISRYLFIIDGTRLRMPEDSLAINELMARIPASEIEDIEIFKGRLHATDGRPALVVTMKGQAPPQRHL